MGPPGPRASEGAFADAAAFGELLFNCTSGVASLKALRAAGANNMEGKIFSTRGPAFNFHVQTTGGRRQTTDTR